MRRLVEDSADEDEDEVILENEKLKGLMTRMEGKV